MALILLIDDDDFYCRIIEQELAAVGHAVVSAQTGAEGIARYRELTPDLVMTDMRLPDIDGAEVIRSIRAINNPAQIIAVSGAGTFYGVDFFKLAREVRANAIVRKLDPMERLVIEVNALLKAPA